MISLKGERPVCLMKTQVVARGCYPERTLRNLHSSVSGKGYLTAYKAVEYLLSVEDRFGRGFSAVDYRNLNHVIRPL